MAVTISLGCDEALVLFELLASKKLEAYVDVPERNALWAVEARLEKLLAEPFSPEYASLLEAARKALIERFGE